MRQRAKVPKEMTKMCDVVCPYSDKCSEYTKSCQTCKRNAGKRNYYEPDYTPYWPWCPTPTYPYYPYQPYAPYWQITASNGNNTLETISIQLTDSSYYQAE